MQLEWSKGATHGLTCPAPPLCGRRRHRNNDASVRDTISGTREPVAETLQEPPPVSELGMARELGPTTWARCAEQLSNPNANVYELSYVRSATMPLSPFAGPYEPTFLPTGGFAGTTQLLNMDVLNDAVNPGQQGTQIDALGHFASNDQAWNGTTELDTSQARYFGGLTQDAVKPTPNSPLLKLGIDKIPPIITTAILLDARAHIGGGKPMEAGEYVTAEHIDEMLQRQQLSDRGILPGDIVFIYTGWSDQYQDPDVSGVYYSMAPGLSPDAAVYLGERQVVGVGLDTPFVDAVAEGQLAGTADPPAGAQAGTPFAAHHHFLTEVGVHTLENIRLRELIEDGVSLSCTLILPPLTQGAAGAPIRPVAIGVPQ